MTALTQARTARLDSYPTRLPEERWLPREEKTVWKPWQPDAPLSQTQLAHFERDGFLVVEDCFSPDEIRALQNEAAVLRNGSRALATDCVITEPGSDEVRTIFMLPEQSRLFARLSSDARLAGIASYLLDDAVYVHQSRFNYKPGLNGKEFYWHSDFETWHAEDGMPRMRAVSASLLLSDNDASNGALLLIPGSHQHFIACAGKTPEANHLSSLKKQEIGVPSPQALTKLVAERGIHTATGKAGTLIFFDCNTLHGSNGNITPLARSNAFLVFNALSNQLQAPYAAPQPRPHFLAARRNVAALQIKTGNFA